MEIQERKTEDIWTLIDRETDRWRDRQMERQTDGERKLER